MIATVALILALLDPTGQAAFDPNAEVPPACRMDDAGNIDFQVCADTAPKGSMPRSLALINLASRAYLEGDFTRAVALYDEAIPPGVAVTSDVVFHTFRADTYDHVGRTEEARADAVLAWRILQGEISPSGDPADDLPVTDQIRFEVLIRILPILKDGDPAAFATARTLFMGLPAEDGIALTNRARLFAKLGDYPAAIADSERALTLMPDEPGLKNNHCFTLFQAGRAAEGLPYCEAAVAALPAIAPIRHSYAEVLAALGRCDEANAQMAEARRLDPSGVAYARPVACTAA